MQRVVKTAASKSTQKDATAVASQTPQHLKEEEPTAEQQRPPQKQKEKEKEKEKENRKTPTSSSETLKKTSETLKKERQQQQQQQQRRIKIDEIQDDTPSSSSSSTSRSRSISLKPGDVAGHDTPFAVTQSPATNFQPHLRSNISSSWIVQLLSSTSQATVKKKIENKKPLLLFKDLQEDFDIISHDISVDRFTPTTPKKSTTARTSTNLLRIHVQNCTDVELSAMLEALVKCRRDAMAQATAKWVYDNKYKNLFLTQEDWIEYDKLAEQERQIEEEAEEKVKERGEEEEEEEEEEYTGDSDIDSEAGEWVDSEEEDEERKLQKKKEEIDTSKEKKKEKGKSKADKQQKEEAEEEQEEEEETEKIQVTQKKDAGTLKDKSVILFPPSPPPAPTKENKSHNLPSAGRVSLPLHSTEPPLPVIKTSFGAFKTSTTTTATTTTTSLRSSPFKR